jgi:ribonuclease P protein component
VVRHRVARRIRHVAANHLDSLPTGSLLVLRALPQAADAHSSTLENEISSAVKTLTTSVKSTHA